MVIGTLAVDGWAVTFSTARRAWRAAALPRLSSLYQQQCLFAMKNINMHINVNDRRAARKEYFIVLAAHDN